MKKVEEVINKREWTYYKDIDLNQSGVYLIVFNKTNKKYFGSTKNLYIRLSTHIFNLGHRKQINWYAAAALENELPFAIPPGRPVYSPPPDPRDEKDKNGHRIGDRISKKKEFEYAQLKASYDDDYYEKLGDWRRRFPIVRKVDYGYAGRGWEIPKEHYLRFFDIWVCPCGDYREYESEILKAIAAEDRDQYYNKQFK